ncbi:CPBP family glutamic-type intramembrane protease [Pseudoduganella violaceinigra]|uniref:CPBP family glutamic-type intramembrane protease n=1 Tax=Pseudoduganella violaceinigra TaxID=246602 RepID=UPI0003F9DFFF|nr:CPBP family intramembrane glutamic endopeptidase [Pseudoduganella violaceinigra]
MQKRLIAGGFAAGFPGVFAIAFLFLPPLLAGKPLPMPMWAVQMIAALQSSILLAIAVAVGACLAPKVGLRAPLLSALVSRASPWQALKPALLPGVAGGLFGAVSIWLLSQAAPPQLQVKTPVPLIARVLYGGITEELLLRWGFMTLVAWILWRLLQKRALTPPPAVIVASIFLSALLFGAGHLPAAAALTGHLSSGIVAYVMIGNAAFGIVAGYLYWKAGLEAAIIAHVTTHLVLYFAIS